MFGIQEHLIREVSGIKERGVGEEMDPVRSWVRNVGVVDANVAAQRYSTSSPDVHSAFTRARVQRDKKMNFATVSCVFLSFHDGKRIFLSGKMRTTCCKRRRKSQMQLVEWLNYYCDYDCSYYYHRQ